MSFIAKALISGLLIALVSELAPRLPRLGALILSLPLVSIGAFLLLWWQEKNLMLIAQIVRETNHIGYTRLGFFRAVSLLQSIGAKFLARLLAWHLRGHLDDGFVVGI